MEKSVFICPVCREALLSDGKSLFCRNGHLFDIAKSGYVNLLLSGSMGHHGDDKLMVKSRTLFLDKGYYGPLKDAVTDMLKGLGLSGKTVVDAGCGEGYYTKAIEDTTGATVIGIDISKGALVSAAKRSRTLKLAVGSTSSVPLADKSADAVVNIFSPLFENEFSRILKDGGNLLRVVPEKKHLMELKEAVYNKAYENPEPETKLGGFKEKDSRRLEYNFTLEDGESIRQLFGMTPYYYKTGKADQARLDGLSSLKTTAAFRIVLYEKVIK